MVVPPAAAAPAATETPSLVSRSRIAQWLVTLGLCLGASTHACAQEEPPSGWEVENVRLRMAVFQQEGLGLQSRALQNGSNRGSEYAWIFQPMGSFRVRQDRVTTHDITIPVDIVTSASTDALDAISSASRENEAGSLDVVDTIQINDAQRVAIHWGAHFEEYMAAQFLGVSHTVSFAEDNATLRTGLEMILDQRDAITPQGFDPGPVVNRFTISVNGAISQLLSPTTMVSAGYTFTGQFGRLETTYNSVPVIEGGRAADVFPWFRARHAITGELRQAILETQTFLALSYRFYADSFDATAHTTRIGATQLFGPFWLRGHYRLHHQDAPSFWRDSIALDDVARLFRTADSDLETLFAHELGATVRWFFEDGDRGALNASSSYLQAGFLYYWRDNGLRMHVTSLDFGYSF